MPADQIKAELAALHDCDPLARSPTLLRLLDYLVEATLRGEGGALKSYTVAVEGLGREPDYDPQVNTYARVQVGRLRQTLDQFYADEGAARPMRLVIPRGSYRVTLMPNARAAAVPGAALLAPGAVSRLARWAGAVPRRLRRAAALALGLGALVLGVVVVVERDRAAVTWTTPDFPVVYVRVPAAGDPALADRLQDLRREAAANIDRFEVFRSAGAVDRNTDYILDFIPDEGAAPQSASLILLDRRRNRMNVVGTVPLPGLDRPSGAQLQRAIFMVLGFDGLINERERRAVQKPASPYACWLMFRDTLLREPGLPDPALQSCAEEWYAHDPVRPTAAAAWGWVLQNDALVAPLAGMRRQKLDQAIAVLEGARSLNRKSTFLMLSLARAYSLAGDRASLAAVSRQLVAATPDNPEILNAIGLMLVLQNVSEGEAHLDASIALYPEGAPPRFYLGKVVAAMMHDDLPGTRAALEQLGQQNRSSVWLKVFSAAYYARTGDLEKARACWQEYRAMRAIFGLRPRLAIDSSPADRAVKARLLAWLDPLL